MRIEITEAELDYIYRLLMARPMGEVEPLVVNIRVQIAKLQREQTLPDDLGDDPPELP